MPSSPDSPSGGTEPTPAAEPADGSGDRRPSRAAILAVVAISVLVPLVALVVILTGAGDDGASEVSPGSTLPPGVASAGVEMGEPLPDFELPGLDGEPIRLSDFQGEPLVLTFFASWCNPCEKEMPVLEDALAERPGEFGVLAVSYDDLADDSRAFVEELGVTYPVALDTDGEVKDLYGVHGIPQSFFVDSDGVLVDRVFGITSAARLDEPLDALLAADEA